MISSFTNQSTASPSSKKDWLMKINIEKLHANAKLPIKGDQHAAAWDLYAHSIEDSSSTVFQATPSLIKVGTGVAIEIPMGYMGVVAPRSNISKHSWMLGNSIGIIDPTYSKEWFCMFRPVGLALEPFPYKVGERVAQMFILPTVDFEFNEVETVVDVGRGEGFGSTGLS
jgi:dUTP pyrophosphatase